jgi:hypothetical protein
VGTSGSTVGTRLKRVSLRLVKDLDGRVYGRAYDDSSETEPRPHGEPDELMSDWDETIRLGEYERSWRNRWSGEC